MCQLVRAGKGRGTQMNAPFTSQVRRLKICPLTRISSLQTDPFAPHRLSNAWRHLHLKVGRDRIAICDITGKLEMNCPGRDTCPIESQPVFLTDRVRPIGLSDGLHRRPYRRVVHIPLKMSNNSGREEAGVLGLLKETNSDVPTAYRFAKQIQRAPLNQK